MLIHLLLVLKFILLNVLLCATQDEKNQVLTTYVWYRQVR